MSCFDDRSHWLSAADTKLAGASLLYVMETQKCGHCKKRKPESGRVCSLCKAKQRERHRQKRQEREQAGLCTNCGMSPPVEGAKWCQACRDKGAVRHRSQSAHRLKHNLCYRCASPLGDTPSNYCESCVFKIIAVKNLGDASRADEIAELFDKQSRRCAYTGLPLTLGVDASVDHIIPRSKGGSDALQNLQWVHRQVNRWRSDMDDGDFRQFLLQVSQSILASAI